MPTAPTAHSTPDTPDIPLGMHTPTLWNFGPWHPAVNGSLGPADIPRNLPPPALPVGQDRYAKVKALYDTLPRISGGYRAVLGADGMKRRTWVQVPWEPMYGANYKVMGWEYLQPRKSLLWAVLHPLVAWQTYTVWRYLKKYDKAQRALADKHAKERGVSPEIPPFSSRQWRCSTK